MNRAWMALLGCLLTGTLAFAQEPMDAVNVTSEQINSIASQGQEPNDRFYVRGEYLLWWLTNAPNRTPLLTTGNPAANANAGILGAASTQVLFGGRDIDLSSFSGGRFTAGYWLGEGDFGIEGSGFFLGNQTQTFSAQANGAGAPTLGIPFLGAGGQEGRLILANPGANLVNANMGAGSFSASTSTRFWGAEANGMLKVVREASLRADLLAGFCYRQFNEDLNLSYNLPPVMVAADPLNLAGNPGGSFGGSATDRFATRNQFYGGQMGARIGYQLDRLSVDLLGKVALGTNHQTVSIRGSSTFQSTGEFAGLGPATSPFGVFAQGSNIGTRTRDHFTAIPEATLQLGYNLTSSLKIFAGYNVIYWSDVVRPGNQIDRTINTAAVPPRADFVSGLQSDVRAMGGRPAPQFNQSDLWVQGVTFGLEFRY